MEALPALHNHVSAGASAKRTQRYSGAFTRETRAALRPSPLASPRERSARLRWHGPHVVRPVAPDGERPAHLGVPYRAHRPRPEREQRTRDAASARDPLVVLAIERRGSTILLADRVDVRDRAALRCMRSAPRAGSCAANPSERVVDHSLRVAARSCAPAAAPAAPAATRPVGQANRASARRNASPIGTMSSTASDRRADDRAPVDKPRGRLDRVRQGEAREPECSITSPCRAPSRASSTARDQVEAGIRSRRSREGRRRRR